LRNSRFSLLDNAYKLSQNYVKVTSFHTEKSLPSDVQLQFHVGKSIINGDQATQNSADNMIFGQTHSSFGHSLPCKNTINE